MKVKVDDELIDMNTIKSMDIGIGNRIRVFENENHQGMYETIGMYDDYDIACEVFDDLFRHLNEPDDFIYVMPEDDEEWIKRRPFGGDAKRDCKMIVNHYGPQHQLIKLFEELGELQQAVAKSIMYAMDTEKLTQSEDHSEVLTELADVKIMLEQTQYIYGIKDKELTNEINYKLNRQIERIREE